MLRAVTSQSTSMPVSLSFTIASNLYSLEPENKLSWPKSKTQANGSAHPNTRQGCRPNLFQGIGNRWPECKRRKDICLWIPLDLQTGYGMQMLSHWELAARSSWHISMTITSFLLHQPHLYGALFSFEGEGQRAPLLLTEFLEKICFILEITI